MKDRAYLTNIGLDWTNILDTLASGLDKLILDKLTAEFGKHIGQTAGMDKRIGQTHFVQTHSRIGQTYWTNSQWANSHPYWTNILDRLHQDLKKKKGMVES